MRRRRLKNQMIFTLNRMLSRTLCLVALLWRPKNKVFLTSTLKKYQLTRRILDLMSSNLSKLPMNRKHLMSSTFSRLLMALTTLRRLTNLS